MEGFHLMNNVVCYRHGRERTRDLTSSVANPGVDTSSRSIKSELWSMNDVCLPCEE